MKKSIEKINKLYVICSIDLSGKTVYLNSLHNHKWEITPDIERASKTLSRKVANMVLEGYYQDMGNESEFVIIPMEVEYRLIDES
jgi:hypothetical protein